MKNLLIFIGSFLAILLLVNAGTQSNYITNWTFNTTNEPTTTLVPTEKVSPLRLKEPQGITDDQTMAVEGYTVNREALEL